MRIAFWDVETTSLNAGIGRLLCSSVYTYPSSRMKTFRIDEINNGEEPWDDAKLAVAARDRLAEHDMVVTWYGKGFDLGFLNTRLAAAGENLISRHFHLDLYWYARGWHGIKPGGASLKNVASFFKLEERKMEIEKEIWTRAGMGDSLAIDQIAERCESDVRILYEVYKKMMDLKLVSRIERYGR